MHVFRSALPCARFAVLLACVYLQATASVAQNSLNVKTAAGEPQWIWSASRSKDAIPEGACYFRKAFNLREVEQAQIQIACDDRFELFVNGRSVGKGDDWKVLHSFDVRRVFQPGRNVIAVRAENIRPGSAGLVVRVTAKQKGNTDVSYSSDASWKVSDREVAGWERPGFNDGDWQPAQSFGELGRAAPWGDQVVAVDGTQAGRFLIAAEFRVEQVLPPSKSGSLIAMAFNEFGDILASQEGGPLMIFVDKDEDGVHDTISTYCDKLKNCQGMLALNGQVFAVGDGPDGTALYRLSDEDANRQVDQIKTLFKFKGGMGEHGPHVPVLGPDGMIYVLIGNHTAAERVSDADSPHHNYYEGDLIQPKYEDAGGHAVGIKAPGGVVLRTDVDGSFLQTFAGGFRNAYDIAFNRQGDLFTFDSDMEWDEGLPWYRPTRINHVTAGGEFGWRSGWSKWPAYYIDSLPSTLDVGRGSPTGVEVYNHYMFPLRYHNALFACDWAQGRILAIRMKPANGTYECQSEVFLQGRPLNVTDIAVGPDGWLYFVTGGRGTEGGVYRVCWNGRVPPQPELKGIARAVRQPQLASAWARQQIAGIQQEMGADWDRILPGVADNTVNSPEDRTRALDLMQLLGPHPKTEQLVRLSRDPSPEIRAKAAYLMGLHVDESTKDPLVRLLADTDATVRRAACEAMVRGKYEMPVDVLLELVADPNRYVAWAARRALEQAPRNAWKDRVLDSKNLRVYVVGATALLVLDPDRATVTAVLARGGEWMKGDMGDDDFLDLLRVFQLALHRGKLGADAVPQLAKQLAEEYPSAEPRMNRELVRLLVHLQQGQVLPRMEAVLTSDAPLVEKLHLAFNLRFLDAGWNTERKLGMLEFYEQARKQPGGHSYSLYLDNVSRDFFAKFNDSERRAVLAQGSRWPGAALAALASLPEKPGDDVISDLIALDGELQSVDTPQARMLATGIVAVIGRSRDDRGMAYLRERFESEPNRRQDFAMGLAQQPNGANWPLLLRALPVVEGGAAQMVITQLARVKRKVEEPEPIRQVILCGLKLKENGAKEAANLLAVWTGEQASPKEASWDVAMASWQKWFAEHYPDQPPAALPDDQSANNKWSYDDVMSFLNGEEGAKGDPQRGAVVFEKAQCIRCHRYGPRGEGVGPDLSTVSQRFQKKEIVESVLYPSQVISDQYKSKTVTTDDGRAFMGIVGEAGVNNIVVLQSNGEKVTLRRDSVEEIAPNAKSAMPEGLFNTLSLEEIADLFAYLSSPAAK